MAVTAALRAIDVLILYCLKHGFSNVVPQEIDLVQGDQMSQIQLQLITGLFVYVATYGIGSFLPQHRLMAA